MEALARLKPAFALPDGEDRRRCDSRHGHRRQRPGITDGAAATVVASERAVERLGLTPLVRIVGYAQAEVEPKWLFLAPIEGVRRLLDRIELPIEAFDLIESTRTSPPRRSRMVAPSASIGRRSMSTAARSRSVTPSVPVGPGSSPRSYTNSPAARAGTGWRRCASAVAARSQRRSNASDSALTAAGNMTHHTGTPTGSPTSPRCVASVGSAEHCPAVHQPHLCDVECPCLPVYGTATRPYPVRPSKWSPELPLIDHHP